MGYLTPMFVYNDDIHNIKDSVDLGLRIYQTSLERGRTDLPDSTTGRAPVTVFPARHADDHRCYVLQGNTMTEMSPYSKETQDLIKNHPDFFKALLKTMKDNVKELENLFQEVSES